MGNEDGRYGGSVAAMGAIYLLKGDDDVLMTQSVRQHVDELVDGGDAMLMVEEKGEADYTADGDADLTTLVTSAQTPPFLTERRVVVGRNLGLFGRAEQVAPLVAWLEAPTESTDLVLVWEKGANSQRLPAIPKSLKAALKAAGVTEVDVAPSGRGRKGLIDRFLAEAPVRFEPAAKAAIVDRLGDDAGRVRPLVELLVSTYGSGAVVSASDVSPFLGEASEVPPWDLTDAIDDGDIALALDRLHRMIVGGDRHPLQILATLHTHYQRALALDGAGISDDRAAADRLGMKGSTFPAKKALSLARRLRSQRIREAILLLAAADLDLRGRSAIPPDAQMDVLVARLARLSR